MTNEKMYEKLVDFVHFIANDYCELSHDKVQWQRDDYIKRARKLMQEIYVYEDSIDSTVGSAGG